VEDLLRKEEEEKWEAFKKNVISKPLSSFSAI
jgi:hypothetical protein